MTPSESSRPVEEISRFLGQWQARDLITCFDVDFDVPFHHGRCIGLLEMLDAFAPASVRPADRAQRIGAFWCRIVRADVTYRLLEGLEAIEASRGDAEALHQFLESGRSSGLLAADASFVAYAAARWWDGAGKIQYRFGDFSSARLGFERSSQLAERFGLWHCLPDLRSNYLRVQHEEHAQVARQADLATTYHEAVLRVEEDAARRRIAIPAAGAGTSPAPAAVPTREFLRGLASLYHNLALELRRRDADASLGFSNRSAAICRSLGDDYRLGQALNHQAFLALDQGASGLARARSLFDDVQRLQGERARRIAAQNLAEIDRREGDLGSSLDRLETLLDSLRRDRQQRGGDLGFDTSFHHATVQKLGDVLGAQGAAEAIGEDRWNAWKQRLDAEYLDSVRSVRRVVKISQYKQAFSDRYYPVYLRLIASELTHADRDHRSASERNEQVCALVEEASGRELLDLMSGTQAPIADAPDFVATGPVRISAGPERRGGRRTARRSPVRRGALGDDQIRAALDSRRVGYERLSLRTPIPTASFDPEIGHKLKMFTANEPGLVIVRYFLHGGAAKPQLAALVFRSAQIHHVPLDWERVKSELVTPWDSVMEADDAPLEKFDAGALYRLLVAPWWPLAAGALEGGVSQLVLIPADELFKLPIHVALVPEAADRPMCAILPVCYSVSATAFLNRGRHLLRRQYIQETDDLCAVVFLDENASAGELTGLEWPAKYFQLAGTPPKNIGPHTLLGPANWDSLRKTSLEAPEFFVYSGHGVYYREFSVLGPALLLDSDVMTQYDVVQRLRLHHNKLTLLGACVSGQGSSLGGGEVAGFLRAFTAAGAGALGITLWSVLDERVSATVRHVLRSARAHVGRNFDVLAVLLEHYREACDAESDPIERMEACPLALYL